MAWTYSVPVSITLAECDLKENEVHWEWLLKILHSLPTQMREDAPEISLQIFSTGEKVEEIFSISLFFSFFNQF